MPVGPDDPLSRLRRITRKELPYLFLVLCSSSHLIQGFGRRAPSGGDYLAEFEAAYLSILHHESKRKGRQRKPGLAASYLDMGLGGWADLDPLRGNLHHFEVSS